MYARNLVRILGTVVGGGLLGMGAMALCALLLVGQEAIENVLVFGLVIGVFAGIATTVMTYSAVESDFWTGYSRRFGDAHYRRISGQDDDER